MSEEYNYDDSAAYTTDTTAPAVPGITTAALVVAIVALSCSLLCCCTTITEVVALLAAIAGLVLSIVARKKCADAGVMVPTKVNVAMVLSIIAIVISLLLTIVNVGFGIASLSTDWQEIMNELNY